MYYVSGYTQSSANNAPCHNGTNTQSSRLRKTTLSPRARSLLHDASSPSTLTTFCNNNVQTLWCRSTFQISFCIRIPYNRRQPARNFSPKWYKCMNNVDILYAADDLSFIFALIFFSSGQIPPRPEAIFSFVHYTNNVDYKIVFFSISSHLFAPNVISFLLSLLLRYSRISNSTLRRAIQLNRIDSR